MSDKKIFTLIVVAALLMRFAALFSFAEEMSLLYVNDSQTYLQTAKNFLNHGVYSMEISDMPHPDNFRTPLYPLFLLPFVWLKSTLYVPAIIQSLIMSLGAGLVFLLGKKFFQRKVAIVSALLFALEPVGSLISAQIMAEAIFTPLFLGALFSLLTHIKTSQTKFLWLGSALLAVSALARPIAFPLFVLLPIAVWFVHAHAYRQTIKQTLLSVGIFFAILSPWLYHSFVTVRSDSFSSIVWTQGYEYRAKYFDVWRANRGAPNDDRLPYVDMRTVNDTLNAQAIPPIKTVVTKYLEDHLPEYLWFHIVRTPYLFTDSGYVSILNGISPLHFQYDTTHGTVSSGFLEQMFVQPLARTFNQIKQQPPLLILAIADLLFVLITLLALSYPLLYYWKHRMWSKETLFLIMFILLYSLIASPIGGPRFRIPLNPLLFLLAFENIFLIPKLFEVKKTLDPSRMTHSQTVLRIALGISIIIAALGFFTDLHNTRIYGGVDLRNRVVGTRVATELGRDPYVSKWSEDQSDRYLDPSDNAAIPVTRLTVTPAVLSLYSLFSSLPYRYIRYLWFVVQWASLLGSIFLLSKTLAETREERTAIWILGLLGISGSMFWRLHAERGQMYILYVFLFSLSFYWYNRYNKKTNTAKFQSLEIMSAIAMGYLVSLRPTFIFAFIPFAIYKRWRFVSFATGAMLGSVLISSFLSPTPLWKNYYDAMQAQSAMFADETIEYQSYDRVVAEGMDVKSFLSVPGEDSSLLRIFRGLFNTWFSSTTLFILLLTLIIPLSLFLLTRKIPDIDTTHLFFFAITLSFVSEFFIANARWPYANTIWLIPLAMVISGLKKMTPSPLLISSYILAFVGVLTNIGFHLIAHLTFVGDACVPIAVLLYMIALLTQKTDTRSVCLTCPAEIK